MAYLEKQGAKVLKTLKTHYRKKELLTAYLFIAPFFILFLVFQLYPMVWSLVLSFHEWNGLSPMTFIGMQNYARILDDPLLWTSMYNTFIYLFFNLVFVIPIAVLLGQMLCTCGKRIRKFFKTVLVLPFITSTVAAGTIFFMLFDTRIGVINGILGTIGLEPVPWLTDMGLSKIPVIILSLWRNFPWYMLIVMSGMLGIDATLFEAARVDGANAFQRMLRITIPSIAPVLFFSIINLTIDSARIFTEPYILTKGGPGSSSLSAVQYMYDMGFTSFRLGYSSAIGYTLITILAIISVLNFMLLRRQSREV